MIALRNSSTTSLGDNVRQRRLELELTLADLAKMLGLKSPNSIAKIERGQTALPHIDTLDKLSKALRTPVPTLLGIPPVSADAPTETLLAMSSSLRTFLKANRSELAIDSKDEEYLRSLSVNISISTFFKTEWWEGELRNYRKYLKS